MGGLRQQWQADIVDLSNLKKTENDDMTFLLTMVFSKVAQCVGASLVAALTTTFTDDWPKTLQTYQGLEFLNKSVQAILQQCGIHLLSTHNAETKASIMERFNRTLKTRMWRYFTKHQTWLYIDVLQDLVHSYNNTPHRSIGIAPSQVSANNNEKVWQRLYGHNGKGVPKLRVSDRVRVSMYMYENGYADNWSEEMFTIHEVHPSNPPVNRLSEDLGEVLDGTSYELELQKVSVPGDKVYRVESVLQEGRQTKGGFGDMVRLPLQIQQLDRCQGARPLHFKD